VCGDWGVVYGWLGVCVVVIACVCVFLPLSASD